MNCNRFVEAWGSAEGPVKHQTPATRLLTGGLLFASVLVSNPAGMLGLVLTLAICAGWFLTVQPPRLLIGPLLLFAFILFVPFFILTPWIETTSQRADLLVPMPWSVPWRIAVKGGAALLVSAWTASTLALFELEDALIQLRVPRPVAELLLQIIHQAHALVHETRNMMQAMWVRGAADGWRSALVLATALPRVWLPRVLYRADRIGDAMELRDFEIPSRKERNTGLPASDRIMRMLAILVILTAVALRWVEVLSCN